ncbi:Pantothenate kinase type III, CoaX-like protein [Methylophaga frappieri]|uniref:Type III pantothenate kinase n=1 Tax=Methylophaga frappieri (strain ATCC BAA-2434 / DSM 25690 / JAM7) TaxID=754477 RepID=I1YFU8_METFJ|nr:type III pantothenate kinase [Methylophaga frappieri]AFJ01791.1 Pantothenate kinase type III, CoaX-like protein [Methylophaga frappieri]
MKLLVDIGNSRIKWATLDGKKMSATQDFERKSGIKAQLTKHWKSLEHIESIWVANVAGEKMASQLSEWANKKWQRQPVFITTEARRFGVKNAYDNPEQLGVDRWLSLVAMRQRNKQTTCIIDCGTAITVDLLSTDGQHQGGLILPGLTLIRQTLIQGTDAITEKTEDVAFSLLATNTFSAIQAGSLYSISATLHSLIEDLQQNFKQNLRIVLTGGDAATLQKYLPAKVELNPDLVLKGLRRYAQQEVVTAESQPEEA